MPNRKAARFLVRLVVLGTAAGTLAGFSGYAMLPSRALSADPVTFAAALGSQVPNRAVKADRLAPVPAKLAAAEGATYSLASATTTIEFDRGQDSIGRIQDTVAARPPAAPLVKAEQPQPQESEPKLAALPLVKSRKLPPPPAPPPVTSGSILDDAHIAGIRSRLRLTADQAEYWPSVEAALRDVARTQLREGRIKHTHGRASIDTDAPEVQNLKWAAMPLLMRLREDQKNEVRKLVRIIGLDSVASLI